MQAEKKSGLKCNILFSLFFLLFILNLGAAAVSNFSMNIFLLKAVSSFMLMLVLILFLRNSETGIRDFILSDHIKVLYLFLGILILYPALTLVYSGNYGYGFQKILNFVVCIVPIVLSAKLLDAVKWNISFGKLSLALISLIVIVTFIAVIIVHPFEHSTVYAFEPGRWSHVFVGRIISFLLLVLLMVLLNSRKKLCIRLTPVVVLGFYLVYLTGLRSAILGVMLFSIIYAVYYLIKKRLFKYHYYALIIIITCSILLILITGVIIPYDVKTSGRIENLLQIENLYFGGEAGLQARISSAKIAWEMFLNNPLIGNGYGSFNGYNNIKWTLDQKYPHNIILEILSEFGIIGLLFFGYVFYKIIYSINHLSDGTGFATRLPLLILLFFSLWLAMFSKDLSTQSLLWIFLALIDKHKFSEAKHF